MSSAAPTEPTAGAGPTAGQARPTAPQASSRPGPGEVLWTEWRHCDDPAGAARILALVDRTPFPPGPGRTVARQALVRWIAAGFFLPIAAGAVANMALTSTPHALRIGPSLGTKLWAYGMPLGTGLGLAVGLHARRQIVEASGTWVRGLGRMDAGLRIAMQTAICVLGLYVLHVVALVQFHQPLYERFGWNWQSVVGRADALALAVLALLAWVGWRRERRRPQRGWKGWGPRPAPSSLLAALERVAPRPDWIARLLERSLDRAGGESAASLLGHPGRSGWESTISAAVALEARGTQALPELIRIAESGAPSARTARWALEAVSAASRDRFGEDPAAWICPECIRRFVARPLAALGAAPVSGDADFVACPGCLADRPLHLNDGGRIVACLDRDLLEVTWSPEGDLHVPALERDPSFDFEQVLVGRASDADVEAFAIRFSNLQASSSRSRGGHAIPCTISKTASLSLNTRRVLERTFGA